jgi:saccharopine dehydrogenase-like NADP-dependent oxidoreductase
MKSVLVLGGYGNFGRRIVAALAREPDCRVFVCGRNAEKAALAAREAGGSAAPLAVDCHGRDFSGVLRRLGATLVIHTAGPFHGQRYTVPRACIAAGAHYLDLADARGYVCGIGVLDAEARESDVLITSGTSSLPALSSAVVDALRGQFSAIDSIDHGITSGAKPPGRATMQGALGYAGKPFLQWCEGNWRSVHGWQGITRRRYPSPVGARWLADCDVPDLELFPRRFCFSRSRAACFCASCCFFRAASSALGSSGFGRFGSGGGLTSRALVDAAKSENPPGKMSTWASRTLTIRVVTLSRKRRS